MKITIGKKKDTSIKKINKKTFTRGVGSHGGAHVRGRGGPG